MQHCQQLELPVHANIAAEKKLNVFLKLKRGDKINIDDWLQDKGPSLKVALDLLDASTKPCGYDRERQRLVTKLNFLL
jgi:hypothetical protein